MADLDAEYVAKMEDVLALYERPYDATEPVVCLDEKPVSLHADVRPARPARPGRIGRRDNEYRRCGTANVFAIVEPKAGRHFTCATVDRSALQFARQVRRIVTAYPDARTIHVVWDNLNIHCEKSLLDAFGVEVGGALWRRITVHPTPKHGSWLNQAEIELSLVSGGCLGTRRLPDLFLLQREVRAWTDRGIGRIRDTPVSVLDGPRLPLPRGRRTLLKVLAGVMLGPGSVAVVALLTRRARTRSREAG